MNDAGWIGLALANPATRPTVRSETMHTDIFYLMDE